MIDLSPSLIPAEELAANNINPKSYLAADYLNHFNEEIMLFDMLRDMPDMVDEVLAWEPKSYVAHFAQSGFAGREMAIRAFHLAPAAVRRKFDAVVSEIDTLILSTISELRRVRDDPQALARYARGASSDLHVLVEEASGIINGADCAEIEPSDSETHAQTTIDKVFARA